MDNNIDIDIDIGIGIGIDIDIAITFALYHHHGALLQKNLIRKINKFYYKKDKSKYLQHSYFSTTTSFCKHR